MPFSIARRWGVNLAVAATALTVLIGGTWTVMQVTIERLLHTDAIAAGHRWASYLAHSVPDLAEIAKGRQPLPSSMMFFERAQRAGNVFRYKIFSPEGYLRLVSDDLSPLGTDSKDLGEHNAAAARALAEGKPLVTAKTGKPPGRPAFFSEAYVPVAAGGRTIGVVEVYVDQTDKRHQYYTALTLAAVALSLLMALGFGVPATAWYRRTKEKKEAEERIRFLAFHDALTSLPNRNRLLEGLDLKLQACVAEGKVLAVHYVDIDSFKSVNDALGHDIGDQLIVGIARRLREIAGPEDIVSRLSGDEFVLVQCNAAGRDDAEAAAGRLIGAMAKPFHLNGHEIAATVSVGTALAPADGVDPAQLIRSADLAMYKSKSDGRNCARFFVEDMETARQAQLEIEKLIRDAEHNGMFELHFQPIASVPDGHIVGFEALLRLRTQDGSFIPPAVFVSVAERMGLIADIGTWVIREACRTAATWPDRLTLAVNLSPVQFTKGSVRTVVADALRETGLAPQRLELEITESLLLEDTGDVLAELESLRALGVIIVMDDFGIGYSSLSYLWRFPVSKIKIDRSFMHAFDAAEGNARSILSTIVSLARLLSMRVTVEGVENERQLAFTHDLRCDEVQGFYYGAAVPPDEIASRILGAADAAQLGHTRATAAA